MRRVGVLLPQQWRLASSVSLAESRRQCSRTPKPTTGSNNNNNNNSPAPTESPQPSATTQPPAAAVVPGPVLRSLYRAILSEAIKLDRMPLLKTLLPLSKHMQECLMVDYSLYPPNGPSYAAAVRRVFRSGSGGPSHGPASGKAISAAFDALNRLRYHNKEVRELLQPSEKERELFAAAVEAQFPPGGTHYAIAVSSDGTSANRPPSSASAHEALSPKRYGVPRSADSTRREVSLRSRPVELRLGLGLIAHPLSSAHADRRVMLITGRTASVTTALVLDMQYSFPLSSGNPMFPEVFWGHEVYNGGFLHVDFTMPPTAHVTILHTIPPPTSLPSTIAGRGGMGGESPHHDALPWTKWLKAHALRLPSGGSDTATSGGGLVSPVASAALTEHHELLCKPLIRGRVRPDGTSEPTLYLSRVEALPYLATLVPGLPRSVLRIYWGCMRWQTQQLAQEVSSGHWVPVELSPTFFATYPMTPSNASAGTGNSSSASSDVPDAAKSGDEASSARGSAAARKTFLSGIAAAVGAASTRALAVDDRFPTSDELHDTKELRVKHHQVDVVSPQVFPPEMPVCRREVLWDQIVSALGGEYKALVGCSNPFAKPSPARSPPAEIVTDESGAAQAAAAAAAAAAASSSIDDAVIGTLFPDDDDDEGGV